MATAVPKRRSRRRPWWPWLILALVVVGGGAYALLRPKDDGTATAAVAIKTATASLQDFRDAVSGSGTVTANATYNLTAKVNGSVKWVLPEGTRVKKGQVVARLETAPFQRALETNQLNLAKAQAQLAGLQASQSSNRSSNLQSVSQARTALENAQSDAASALQSLQAQKRIYAVGGVSAQSVTDAQAAYDKAANSVSQAQVALNTALSGSSAKSNSDEQDLRNAQLAVSQAQVSVQSAQEDLANTQVTSPIDGIISTVNVTAGGGASSSSGSGSGSTIMTILDDSTVTVPVQVDETEITKVKVGQRADVTLGALPDQTFTGKVTAVSPAATVQSNIPIFSVSVVLPNPDRTLRPGMSADADIISQEVPNAIVVPLKAVETVRRRSYVTVLGADGKTQEQRRVTTGVDDGTNVVITDGLKDGETLVLPTAAASTTGTTPRNNRGFGGGFF
ncbi:MAG TPA: efflux RND transporter periplasmic adaptor subunit [Deinococcales bacterium]|nr:efflux RND transporter periplasmic adaptor subunit [Deinococcales bacterium]